MTTCKEMCAKIKWNGFFFSNIPSMQTFLQVSLVQGTVRSQCMLGTKYPQSICNIRNTCITYWGNPINELAMQVLFVSNLNYRYTGLTHSPGNSISFLPLSDNDIASISNIEKKTLIEKDLDTFRTVIKKIILHKSI